MKNKSLMLILILLGLGPTGLQAQENTVASGGNASGNGGTSSYTLGQIVFTSQTGTNGSITQGLQHPFEISVVNDINSLGKIDISCSVYPNPTAEYLILRIDDYKSDTLNYQLYDMNGKLLENKKLNESETSITMRNFAPAIYFLKVVNKDKEVKTFKIIKN